MHDVVIRGGTLVDGTGEAPREGDVAIENGVITEVGEVSGEGHRELDARGMLVTPGFVDMHTHFDAQVTWDPDLTPSSWHGVTTVVFGNCGVGFAPARPDRRDWLIGLMEGVEDIPGSALSEGIQWGWETFPEYLDAIEQGDHAIDFGAQIPHGALRAYVMGERGASNEVATPEDIHEMARLVKEAVGAGALGFSTSRTVLHKSIDGIPVPGTFAGREEVFGIAQGLIEANAGVFQSAIEHLNVPEEIDWLIELARMMKRPVMFNLSQTDQSPELWKELARKLDGAAEEGVPVYGQVAGRAIGILMCLQGTAHPFIPYPSWLQMFHEPWEEKWKRLSDPEFRRKLLAEDPVDIGEFEDFVTRSFDKMYLCPDGVDYEPKPEDSLAAIAARTGRKPQEIALETLMEREGSGMIYFPLFNYSDQDLSLLHTLHQHPNTRMGLSDAGAHCGAICDGGMPTFMLTHWTRDRQRGERLPLEYVVHRQTLQTARTYGLDDRGVLAPGKKADVNVIDYDKLAFEAPRLVFDLPAGGKRLLQRASGYVHTMVSGELIVEDGERNEAMPGKLVRGSR